MHASINEYAGYKPGPGAKIEVVQAHDVEPKEFWAKFIAARKPVLIKGHIPDASWKASAKWDDQYLAMVA
eukprot:CAMPEP_0202874288 /NCGR_PEP_ID=MMETSP1391-20130828/25133_1 /ASSEMBLY_ACC=CAM_ASM_000867 /TAXON_ID=1034604 /ORGANISM="Chlamydomonas leiostraca, Strain SAG 11-49" /LENGTH=69 /DNA_ID=CAMNT_0049555697 /DNA_START=37 /DNA_END=243 /DNA_ORIENTATION=+